MLERAGRENFGIPEPMEGWAWVSLDTSDFLEFDRLDELVAEAAASASAAALGFSVHDSDSVYLVGGDPRGRRFRLVVNPEAFEDELPGQEVEEAAAWARDHAPQAPTAEELADVLSRDYVFAEEGLDVLLAGMGLLAAEAAGRAEELSGAGGVGGVERLRFDWNELDLVAAPDRQPLLGRRWWASIADADGKGYLLAVEQDLRVMMFATGMDAPMVEQAIEIMGIPEFAGVTGFAFQSAGKIFFLGHMDSLDAWRLELTQQGVEVSEWREVPDDVARDLAATAAWVSERPGS